MAHAHCQCGQPMRKLGGDGGYMCPAGHHQPTRDAPKPKAAPKKKAAKKKAAKKR